MKLWIDGKWHRALLTTNLNCICGISVTGRKKHGYENDKEIVCVKCFPESVIKKNPNWQQSSPLNELERLIELTIFNHDHANIINASLRVDDYLKEMKELIPFLKDPTLW